MLTFSIDKIYTHSNIDSLQYYTIFKETGQGFSQFFGIAATLSILLTNIGTNFLPSSDFEKNKRFCFVYSAEYAHIFLFFARSEIYAPQYSREILLGVYFNENFRLLREYPAAARIPTAEEYSIEFSPFP